MTALEARMLANQMSGSEEVRRSIDDLIRHKATCGYTDCIYIGTDDMWCDKIVAGLKADGFQVKAGWEKLKYCRKENYIYRISWDKFDCVISKEKKFTW